MAPSPHTTWYPLLRQRMFDRDSSSVGAARRAAEYTLADWSILTERVDDVKVCVSELVTNALVHGTPDAGGILVRFSVRDAMFRVEVGDGATGLPEPRVPTDDKERGRGLLLVAACSDGWGVELQAHQKIVWAQFKVAAAVTTGGVSRRIPAAWAPPKTGPTMNQATSLGLLPDAVPRPTVGPSL